jgi:hypothetical protein
MRIAALSLLAMTSQACAPVEEPRSLPVSQTTVTVDQRIELMGAIQLLSGYFLVSYLDSGYKRDAASFFAGCSDHAAVTKFSKLSASGFDFNNVPEAFISLSEPSELRPRFSLSDSVIASAGGAESLADFWASARDFAQDCRFDEFYASYQSEYQRMVAQSRPTVVASTSSLVAYLGTPLGSTQVILGPLLHDGGFASRIDNEGGQTAAFAYIGPNAITAGSVDFGDAARLQPLVAHEFAHTVINPLTASHRSQVAATAENFGPLRDAMRREGYSSWDQVINESIIRAITSRLTAADRGEEAANSEVAEEVRRGFVYVPALVDELRRYEKSRDANANIEDFYPSLLGVFRQSSAGLLASVATSGR